MVTAWLVCDLTNLQQSSPPPTSEAAIRGIQGAATSCDGDWEAFGIIADAGPVHEEERHTGGINPQTGRCGVVQARDTLSGGGGDIVFNQNVTLNCFDGTFEGVIQIVDGSEQYENLQGTGVIYGTFAFTMSFTELVLHYTIEGTAHFLQ